MVGHVLQGLYGVDAPGDRKSGVALGSDIPTRWLNGPRL